MSVQKNRFISIANRLISSLVPHKYLEEFIGDLDEMHEERKTSRGLFVANLFYWIDTLHLLFGFSSFHFLRNQQNPTIMFRHYVTISFRTIQRSRFSSIITIFGLAAGMGVCLLIFQYVHFETTFDTFHENSEYQYRLIQHDFRNGNDIGTSAYTTYALGERCLENIPEVNHFLRIKPMESSLVVANVERNIIFKEDRIWYTDANFLDFFDFPVLFGDKDNCLQEKHGVVITQSLATKYFGEANPVGKNLKISGGPYTGNFEVTAVLHDIPTNSHLQFDILINIGFYFDHWTSYQGDGGWVNSDFITYLSVDENADNSIIKDKINNVVEKYASEKLVFKEIQRKISLQPLTDIHLHSSFLSDEFTSNNGNIQDVRIVILIGIFIMLMAWVNYINLSTARALERSKEVGIRKSIGAIKKQLVGQFLIESIVLNMIAVLIAMLLAYSLIPLLSSIVGKKIPFEIIFLPEFWMWFSIIILVGSIFSGLYPAIILSSFMPLSVLKGNTVKQGTSGLRRGLLTFQFLISGLLISGTYLVYKQIDFLKNKDLGIDAEKILVLDGPRVILESLKSEGVSLSSKYRVFKSSVTKHHSVSDVTTSSSIPGKDNLFSLDYRKQGEEKNSSVKADVVLVDSDFFKTYDLTILVYDSTINHNSTSERIFINEKALESFAFNSAHEALHAQLINNNKTYEIVGVIKSIEWDSPRYEQKPTVFYIEEEFGLFISLKVNLAYIQESISHIQNSFHEVFPHDPFNYFFLDDEFDNKYHSELQFGKLLNVSSMLAVFIACIGLLALVTYSINNRIKEIGIRKILGADISNIMFLLTKEYIYVISFSILLSVPLIIYMGNFWLKDFANRIEIGGELFLITAVTLFALSALTVGFKILSFARANPVNSLRND